MSKFNELAKNLIENIGKVRVDGVQGSELTSLSTSLEQVSSMVNEHLNTLQTLQNDLVRVFRSNNVIDGKEINTVEKDGYTYKLVEARSNEHRENLFGEEIINNKKEIDELKKIQSAFKELHKSDLSDSALNKFRQDLGQEKPQEKSFSQKVRELFVKIFSWKDTVKEEDKQNAITAIRKNLAELGSSTQSLNAKVEELKPLLDPVIAEKYNARIQDPVKYNQEDWVKQTIDKAMEARKTKDHGRG